MAASGLGQPRHKICDLHDRRGQHALTNSTIASLQTNPFR